MLKIALETYLLSRGLTPERAILAAEVVAPMLQNYLDEATTCRHLPAWIRQTKRQMAQRARALRSPYPDIDEAFAAMAEPSVTEVMDVPPDGDVFVALDALKIDRPRRVLLAGDDESRTGVHFNHLASKHLVSGGGLRLYSYYPVEVVGGFSERWLVDFLTMITGKRVCDVCYARWVDRLAEDHVRFLAVRDDERAAMMVPYLRYIAPYAYFERITDDDGDLICRGR